MLPAAAARAGFCPRPAAAVQPSTLPLDPAACAVPSAAPAGCDRELHPPGWRELLQVLDGELTLERERGGEAHRAVVGDALIFAADRPHRMVVVEPVRGS